MNRDHVIQLLILGLSAAAITLISFGIPWGFAVGLASQPLWIYETVRKRQWGMALLSVYYIIPWSVGIYKQLIPLYFP